MMNAIAQLLEMHSGREKIVRTVSYLSLYLSSISKGRISRDFKTLSEELGYCRLLLRLFDDLPMLRYSLTYGRGSKESDAFLRFLSVLNNIVDQLYYPVEHIAWAADKKFLSFKSTNWWTCSTVLWAISLYINMARSLRIISALQKQTHGLKDLTLHEAIVKQQLEQLLSALKCTADLAIAINFLPFDFLWARKLSTSQVGLCGLASSLLGLILLMRNIN